MLSSGKTIMSALYTKIVLQDSRRGVHYHPKLQEAHSCAEAVLFHVRVNCPSPEGSSAPDMKDRRNLRNAEAVMFLGLTPLGHLSETLCLVNFSVQRNNLSPHWKKLGFFVVFFGGRGQRNSLVFCPSCGLAVVFNFKYWCKTGAEHSIIIKARHSLPDHVAPTSPAAEYSWGMGTREMKSSCFIPLQFRTVLVEYSHCF